MEDCDCKEGMFANPTRRGSWWRGRMGGALVAGARPTPKRLPGAIEYPD